jgi:hypothetical protein
MKKLAVGLIGLIVIAGFLFVVLGPPILPHFEEITHGYSGLDAQITGVGVPDYYVDVTKNVGVTYTFVDVSFAGPLGSTKNGVEAADPTGVSCGIGVPQLYLEDYKLLGSKSEHVGSDNVTTSHKQNIMHLQMSVNLKTAGWGLDWVYDVIFWVQLRQNPNTVFQNANSSYACILDVRTRDAATYVNPNDFVVDPSGGGYDVPLTPVDSTTAPTWVTDAGYSGVISQLTTIKFPVHVVKAIPGSFAGFFRGESEARMTFDIDVLLLGEWVQVRPWVAVTYPPVPPSLWEAIAMFIYLIAGFAITIVLLVKVPDPRFKIVGLIVVWAIIAYQLGWIDQLLGGLSGG